MIPYVNGTYPKPPNFWKYPPIRKSKKSNFWGCPSWQPWLSSSIPSTVTLARVTRCITSFMARPGHAARLARTPDWTGRLAAYDLQMNLYGLLKWLLQLTGVPCIIYYKASCLGLRNKWFWETMEIPANEKLSFVVALRNDPVWTFGLPGCWSKDLDHTHDPFDCVKLD